MEATTFDEVLARLTGVLEDSLRTGDRTGYFAALYYKVWVRARAAASLIRHQRPAS